jgi:hypothetical protein
VTPKNNNQPALRIHHAIHPIDHLQSRIYSQKPGRKPNGFWWSIDKAWASFVRDRQPKGKILGAFTYRITLPPNLQILKLTDWQSLLDFTIRFGTTPAPNGAFFWQTGDISKYDPNQDKYLHTPRKHCRVTMIDWTAVAAEYDGIELPEYTKDDTSRPRIDWLDIDWDVPSGCVWRTAGVLLEILPV